jgi:DNA end-binding protein Ku
MARAIWTGSVAFGLVNVPVGLHSATEDRTIHFNQFEAGTSDRIRYKRVNERTGHEVGLADIVRGHEVDKGDYVLVTDEELEAVEPGRSRTMDITDFVDLAEIDPIYFQKTYYLAPRGDGAERAYALLHRAMADSGRAGIATFVMHGKQYLAAIRAQSDVLALETMFFADEVRSPRDEIDNLPGSEKFPGRELSIAKQLIESMTTAWSPENYQDTYRERVADLIRRKRKGEQIVREGEPAGGQDVTDLMEALRRSAEEMRGRRTGKATAKRGSGGAARSPGKTGAAGKTRSRGTTKSPGKTASAGKTARAGTTTRRKAS